VKFSVFTASTPEWEPAEAARILAEQGWDGIEWRITDQDDADVAGFWSGNRATWPLTGLEEQLETIARITRDAGLEFSGIGGYVRCDNHADVERMLAATAELNAHQVRVTMFPVGLRDYPELFETARADLEWAVERAADLGVKVLVELHHRTITASASAAIRLLDGLDPEHVGVIHDLGNLLIEGQEDAIAAFQMLGPYLAHVHVKNAEWHKTDELAADGAAVWKNRWATLRAGQASVDGYLAALVGHGYDGWITLEDFSTELPVEERTRDDLTFLRGSLGRARAAVER
jgi:sugar phosphate isomerase/epimerase